jgi:serine/threonine protein kinase
MLAKRAAFSISLNIATFDLMGNDSEIQFRNVEHFTDWRPLGVQRCLAASSRNFVGLMEDGLTVLKYPHCKSENAMESLREEAARYHFIGTHENLVAFKAVHADGLLFEYCERGALHTMIDGPIPLSYKQKADIGEQIAHGLAHLHARNYIHCDLNFNNVFMTSGMIAKIGDIQGQLYWPDGTIRMPTMSQENAKSRHPDAGEDEFSQKTDIFALGTLLYHLHHGHPPFPDLNEQTEEELIQAKFHRGEYPVDVQRATGIYKIILKCWSICLGPNPHIARAPILARA